MSSYYCTMTLNDGEEWIISNLEHPLSYFEEVIDIKFYIDRLLRPPIESADTTCFSLTEEQVKSILHHHVNCFCRKSAREIVTQEQNKVFVCNSFGKSLDNISCGFYFPKTAWDNLYNTFKTYNYIDIDYDELCSYPLYNLSFCALFNIPNEFEMEHRDALTNHFGKNPVMKLFREDIPESFTSNWFFRTINRAFPRPENLILPSPPPSPPLLDSSNHPDYFFEF